MEHTLVPKELRQVQLHVRVSFDYAILLRCMRENILMMNAISDKMGMKGAKNSPPSFL